jgi:PPOX class probable FMN-dependent enzyme
MPFDHAVLNAESLRELYRQPHELVLRKQIDHIDDAARAFVEASPFVVVATNGPAGADASPRGGSPGFVAVLDQGRLAMGDLAGNNRLDTHTNLLAHPQVGLLFLVPGVDETLRVNGRATLTTDPVVLDAVAVGGRRPPLAIGIDVEECFIHCAKAFRRSALWEPSSWPAPQNRPSAARALRDHIGLEASADVIAADLEAGYEVTMWEPGG